MPNLDDQLKTLSSIDGIRITKNPSGSRTITIKPQQKPLKLRANKNGKGYLTSYTLPIGAAEARRVGFAEDDGTLNELEKIVDESAHTITFKLKS